MPPEPSPGAKSGGNIRALLEAAGVTTSSAILVTGSGGISALIWLCRRGYDQVGCLRSGNGCACEQPDALLIAQICDLATLDHILRSGPHLREDGVLIFQCRGEAQPLLASLLQRKGFQLERRLHGAHRDLIVARRRSVALAQAA